MFSAVCPETGDATGLITPHVNTDAMNAFLAQFAAELPADAHAAMVLDRAGWHTGGALRVPANVTLLHLPPYAPELNAVERVWAYLRSHYLSNRVFKDYDELFEVVGAAWNRLEQDGLKSICHTEWAERAI